MKSKEGVKGGISSLQSLECTWTTAFPAKVVSLCALSNVMRNYYLQAIRAIVLVLAVTASASAQNPTDSIKELHEVTVTSKQPVRTIAT